MEEEKKRIAGTTDECLKHYITVNNLANVVSARSQIIDAVGVHRGTLHHWINFASGGGMPGGETRVKVRYFLESQGYEVSELKALTATVYAAGALIAQSKLSAQQLAELVGIMPSYLYRILEGDHQPGVSTIQIFEQQILQHKPRLPKRFAALGLKAVSSGPGIGASAGMGNATNSGSGLLRLVGTLLADLAPSVVNAAEQGTESEIELIREVMGTDLLFNFSNAVNALTTNEALHRFRRNRIQN